MQPLFVTGYVVHHPAHDLFIHPVLAGVKHNSNLMNFLLI